jgi:hypothetical protein
MALTGTSFPLPNNMHTTPTGSKPPANLTMLFTSLLSNTNAATHAALLSILQHHPSGPSNADPFTTNTTVTTGSTTSTNNLYGIDPEETNILSQSEVASPPSKPSNPLSIHIHSTSGIITSLLEEQRATCDDDLQLQSCRASDRRAYNYHDALKCKHIILKFAMPTTANSDQAPTTSTLKEVIDSIINSLSLTFVVNIVAIFKYNKPINNIRRTSSTYYSFAFLSLHSTQKQDKNQFTMEYSFLYARLANLVKGPTQALCNIPNLPPNTNFLTITTPYINAMNERLEFLIEGVGLRTLLGQEEHENSDTFRHLGFLIFTALCTCWKLNMHPSHPFPPDLARLLTRYDITHIISTKKVRVRTPENTPKIHNMLGIILTTNEPHATTIRDTLHELCINKQHPLLIFGMHNTFAIHLHMFPTNNDPNRITLGRAINSSNHQLHLTSQFKIIRNVQIHPKFLRQHKNIMQATLGLNNCIALFCNFSSGHGDLHLTAIFNAGCTTPLPQP